MSTFSNLYYCRTVSTPKACDYCSRSTTTCLATQDTLDFVYCCLSHLSDPSFARLAALPPPTALPDLSLEAEVELVIRQHSQRSKDKDKEANKDKSWLATGLSASASGLSALSSATTSLFLAPPPIAKVPIDFKGKAFVLSRELFQARIARSQKQAKVKQSSGRMVNLPSVPTTKPIAK